MDMSHDVVTAALLLYSGNFEFMVLNLRVLLELLDRVFADVEA